jgi:peptidoglycan-N-acetylglucosamine deacetylase
VVVRRPLTAVLLLSLVLSGCGGDPVTELDAVPVADREVGVTVPPTPTPSPAPSTPPPTAPTPTSPTPPAPPTPRPTSPTPGPVPSPSEPAPSPGVPSLPPSLVGAEWDRIPTGEKVVALTFDAGANADAVPSILATLADQDVTATFFLTGAWTQQFPDLARRIASRYPVGNHSITHPEFTGLSDAAVRDELDGAERTIREITGVSTLPLFRFPFGDRDARTIRLVNDAGYGSFRWTVDTLGWRGTSGGMSVAEVVSRVTGTAGAGQIVLLHVGSHPTDGSMLDAEALPSIIRELRERGYRFVDLREALASAS